MIQNTQAQIDARKASTLTHFYIPDDPEKQTPLQKQMVSVWKDRENPHRKGVCKVCGKLMSDKAMIKLLGNKIWPNNCEACDDLVNEHYAITEGDTEGVKADTAWDKNCPMLFKEILKTPRMDTDINWSAYHEVEAWQVGRTGLYITGNSGTGKTASLWALYKKLVDTGNRSVVLIESVELAEKLSLSAKELDSNYVDTLSAIQVLMIDDLGKEKYSQAITTKIYDIVNRRYKQQMPIIITTRYGGEGLEKRFAVSQDDNMGNDICRRIGEMVQGLEF